MASQFPGYIAPAGNATGGGISGGGVSGASSTELLTDGSFKTAEPISGGSTIMGVAFTQSGTLQNAMASVSGRMPAVGVVVSNYLSGVFATVYRGGRLFNAAINFSGWMNQPVYVGRSGQLSASGAPTLSGDIQQIVGVSVQQSGIMVQLGDALEGFVAGSGDIGSGAITGQAGGGFFVIASGTITTSDLGSGAITSGLLTSGGIGRYHLSSGCIIEQVIAGVAISGMIAVSIASGTPYSGASYLVVPAERRSGLRLPAIGVHVGNVLSGQTTQVVLTGIVTTASSGVCASGFQGTYLYVGSGGLIVNLSGYFAGASSGTGPNPALNTGEISGSLVQRLGIAVSGGIFVKPELAPSSGLFSGLLGVY